MMPYRPKMGGFYLTQKRIDKQAELQYIELSCDKGGGMEELFMEIFGFSNNSHRLFFIVSMSFLLITSLGAKQGKNLFASICVMHLIYAVVATVVLVFRIDTDGVFTSHCIWFNMLMSGLYLYMSIYADRRNMRKQK